MDDKTLNSLLTAQSSVMFALVRVFMDKGLLTEAEILQALAPVRSAATTDEARAFVDLMRGVIRLRP
jgi:hypothetical protein